MPCMMHGLMLGPAHRMSFLSFQGYPEGHPAQAPLSFFAE
ncbi:hypothetical protein GGQ89_002701, partial [Sphingomonas yabuuchiae]|nr:hypothetical protein [Sphingomonas yabuuchiae]